MRDSRYRRREIEPYMTETDSAPGLGVRSGPPIIGRWRRGLVAVALSTLVVGVPTDVIDNPVFTRMTPVRWWDYLVLAATAILTGLWAMLPGGMTISGYRATGASLLGSLAVGCPVCNKLVIALLGLSGALAIWAPLQPLLGAGSVLLILLAVLAKWRTASAACPVPARPDPPRVPVAAGVGVGEDVSLWPLEGWETRPDPPG
jgi:hypothetical protein